MPEVLVVSDSPAIRAEVRSVLSGPTMSVRELDDGAAVRAACAQKKPDLVVLDLQIGNMGAIAITLDLRLEASGGRLARMPVLLLLDRRADVFLARRSGAEGFLVKPLDPVRLRRATTALLDGREYEDESYRPPTVTAAAADTATG